MAMTRTAKGTAAAKGTGTTLTVANVAMTAGNALIVGVGFDDSEGKPLSVFWGPRRLREKAYRHNTATGICVGIYVAREVNKTATRDVVVTWTGDIGKRAMFATEISEPGLLGLFPDGSSTRINDTDTTSPGTGQTSALNSTVSYAIGAFVAEGPSSDVVTVPEIEDNDTWQTASLGQRDGTVGAPPVSNIAIQETFLELSYDTSTRARITNDAARQWVSAIHTLGKSPWCQGHNSRVIRPRDDVDNYWMCEASNLSGDREPCVIVDATVTVT